MDLARYIHSWTQQDTVMDLVGYIHGLSRIHYGISMIHSWTQQDIYIHGLSMIHSWTQQNTVMDLVGYSPELSSIHSRTEQNTFLNSMGTFIKLGRQNMIDLLTYYNLFKYLILLLIRNMSEFFIYAFANFSWYGNPTPKNILGVHWDLVTKGQNKNLSTFFLK